MPVFSDPWPHGRTCQYIVPEVLYFTSRYTKNASNLPILKSSSWEEERPFIWLGWHAYGYGYGGENNFFKGDSEHSPHRFLALLLSLFCIMLVQSQICPDPDLIQIPLSTSWAMLVPRVSTNDTYSPEIRVLNRQFLSPCFSISWAPHSPASVPIAKVNVILQLQ